MIGVWLKIMNRREGLDFIFKHLDFWVNAFSNKEKYKIFIYNENIENIPEKYIEYTIINKKKIIEENNCEEITRLVQSTPWLDDKWRGAGFALTTPYWYLTEFEYVWNIDADDLILDCGNKIGHFIEEIEQYVITKNTTVLSSDIYYSTPNDSFSFGITFANRLKFADAIKKALSLQTYNPGWLRNIDFQLCQYFRHVDYQLSPIAFTTIYQFVHGGENGLKSYYDAEKKMCACNLYNKRIQYGAKKDKTLLII